MPIKKTFDFSDVEGWKTTSTHTYVPLKGGKKWRVAVPKLSLMYAARKILDKQGAMTLRGLYYALFGAGWIDNSQKTYKEILIPTMVEARQRGVIKWDQIDDSTRIPQSVQAWVDLADFIDTVKNAYRRDVWIDQKVYIEAWLEKRTGVSQAKIICHPYGVAVNAGNGYDGWSSIYEAAVRFNEMQKKGKKVHVLYIGDFDPSGLQMAFSLKERLSFFVANGVLARMPEFERLGVNDEDISDYDLPEAPGKESDSRAPWMMRNYGKVVQVEMDALWALEENVFHRKLKEAIERIMDMDAFVTTTERQQRQRKTLAKAIDFLVANGHLDDDGDDEEDEE